MKSMKYKRIEDIKDLRDLTWEERMLYDESSRCTGTIW